MSSKHIGNISLNPFFCSKIIRHFITGHNGQVELMTLYLVLPYVLYKPSRNVLKYANKKSNFFTLFIEKGNLQNLGGVERRYDNFKSLSNESIIVAANDGEIIFLDEGKVEERCKSNYKNEKNSTLKEYYRAAYYLGIIFSRYRMVDIFAKSGVKKL